MIKQLKLNLDFDMFLTADYSNSYCCIGHQKEENKDIFKKHGVKTLPESYVSENTQIRQVWWDDKDLKRELGKLVNLDVQTVSSIRQDPGNIIPIHKDKFFKVYSKNPQEKRKMARANVFLEDWKFGHFLQYDDVIAPPWKAGDCYLWDGYLDHLSCNAGLVPKFTLQISGFIL